MIPPFLSRHEKPVNRYREESRVLASPSQIQLQPAAKIALDATCSRLFASPQKSRKILILRFKKHVLKKPQVHRSM
jgi:hypothetical protein